MRECLWIFPLCPFMESRHLKLWCYIAEFWPFFSKDLEIPSWVRHVVCVTTWACARFSEPLAVQDNCPSNKYAEHISSYRNLFSIDLPLGVAHFSGLAFLIWNSKSWRCCHAKWKWMYRFSVRKQHGCQGLNITFNANSLCNWKKWWVETWKILGELPCWYLTSKSSNDFVDFGWLAQSHPSPWKWLRFDPSHCNFLTQECRDCERQFLRNSGQLAKMIFVMHINAYICVW